LRTRITHEKGGGGQEKETRSLRGCITLTRRDGESGGVRNGKDEKGRSKGTDGFSFSVEPSRKKKKKNNDQRGGEDTKVQNGLHPPMKSCVDKRKTDMAGGCTG